MLRLPLVIVLHPTNDLSVKRLVEGGENLARVITLNYQVLFQRFVHKEELLPEYEPGSILLARQPYVVNRVRENYVFLLKKLLKTYRFAYVFDKTLYKSHFLVYDDKAFQQSVFEDLKMPVPRLIDLKENLSNEWPLIIKRRVSSRGKGVYLLKDREQYQRYFERRNINEYIGQEFVDIEHDLRVLVLGDAVLGVMERKVIHHPEGRLGVRSFKTRPLSFLPASVVSNVFRVSYDLGIDFCGFDVGLKPDGSYVFLEYNPTPQFLGFERITKAGVGKKVIRWCLNQALRQAQGKLNGQG